MAQAYRPFTRTETVKARQVTDPEGETIVTDQGPIRVATGDYVTEDSRVIGKDDFEGLGFKTTTKRAKSTKKKTTAKKTTAPTDAKAKVAAARAKKSGK